MSKTPARSIFTGVILIGAGAFLLYQNLVEDIPLWSLLGRAFPLIFLWIGILQIIRYFQYNPAQPQTSRPPTFSWPLVWLGIGIILLLRTTGYIPGILRFFASWWPALIILMGLGKLVDALLPGRSTKIRGNEVVFSIFLTLTGLICTQLVRFDPENWRIPLVSKNAKFRDWIHSSWTYTTEQKINPAGAQNISLTYADGDLRLEPGATNELQVILAEKIYAETESRAKLIKESIRILSRREDDTLVLSLDRGGLEQQMSKVDARIVVPAGLALKIRNDNGSVMTDGLKNPLTIQNRHGNIEIRSHRGNLDLTNSFDQIKLEDLQGNVTVTGKDTRIRIGNLTGDLTIKNMSNDIELADVSGTIKIDLSYGALESRGLTGPVILTGKHNRLELEEVRGGVNAQSSHESCRFVNVEGDLELDCQNARIEVRDLRGNLKGKAKMGQLMAEDVTGEAMLALDNCEGILTRIARTVNITNRMRDITLQDFQGSATLRNEKGNIILRELPASNKVQLDLEARRGDILLYLDGFPLPSGLTYYLECSGRLQSQFKSGGAMEVERGGAGRVLGNTQKTAKNVFLRAIADEGDIRLIRQRSAGQAAEEE